MKLKLAFASVLVLSGCGPSREAMQALQDMQIFENSPEASISYKTLSGWGNDLTLSDVEVRAPAEVMAAMSEGNGDNDPDTPAVPADAKPATVARAKTMSLKGLTLKDGKPVARDIMLNDITPTFPMEGATLSLGSLGFEGMNEATGLYIAGAFTKDGGGAVPALEQWAFTKAGMGDLSLAMVVPQDEGQAGNVNVKFGEISVSNFANAKAGLVRFAGLKGDLDIPGSPAIAGTFDFGKLDISGLNTKLFSDLIMAELQPMMNPDQPVDYAALYKDYTSPLEGGVDGIDWTGMAANISGLKLDVAPVQGLVNRNGDGVVVGSDTPRTAIKFTADSSGGTLGAMGLMMLAMSGYDSNVVEMYLEGHASFDPAKDLTRWDNANIGVTDAFDVKFSGGVLGLKQALPTLMAGFSSMGKMLGDNAGGEPEVEILPDDDEDFDEDFEQDSDDDAGGDDDHADHADHESHEGHEGHEDHTDHDAHADHEDHDAHMDHMDHDGPGDGKTGGNKMGGDNGAAMMGLVMGLLPLQLTDLDISITDKKLVNLIVEPQAIAGGQTVQAYRQDLVNMVTASAAFMTDAGVDPAIASELTTAVSGFIAGPGTFHIQLKPKAPLGVMSAMMTPLTKENLGFSATFTAAEPPVEKVN